MGDILKKEEKRKEGKRKKEEKKKERERERDSKKNYKSTTITTCNRLLTSLTYISYKQCLMKALLREKFQTFTNKKYLIYLLFFSSISYYYQYHILYIYIFQLHFYLSSLDHLLLCIKYIVKYFLWIIVSFYKIINKLIL